MFDDLGKKNFDSKTKESVLSFTVSAGQDNYRCLDLCVNGCKYWL